MCLSLCLALVAGLSGPAAFAQASSIEGSVELMNRRATKIVRSAEPRDAVVFWQSSSSAQAPPIEATINTLDKAFDPRILHVPVGSRVGFPNQDPILHNVFSISRGNRFDLGLYKQGPGENVDFDHPGMVRVFCNVHQKMAAYIYVLPSEHFVVPEANGGFVLSGLPEGKGRLVVWHPRAEPTVVDLDLPAGMTKRDVTVRIIRPRVSKHMNKSGRPYQGVYP